MTSAAGRRRQVLCVPPSAVVQWISVALACAVSTTFVVRALRRQTEATLVTNRSVVNSTLVVRAPFAVPVAGAFAVGRASRHCARPLAQAAGVMSIGLAVLMKLFLFQVRSSRAS